MHAHSLFSRRSLLVEYMCVVRFLARNMHVSAPGYQMVEWLAHNHISNMQQSTHMVLSISVGFENEKRHICVVIIKIMNHFRCDFFHRCLASECSCAYKVDFVWVSEWEPRSSSHFNWHCIHLFVTYLLFHILPERIEIDQKIRFFLNLIYIHFEVREIRITRYFWGYVKMSMMDQFYCIYILVTMNRIVSFTNVISHYFFCCTLSFSFLRSHFSLYTLGLYCGHFFEHVSLPSVFNVYIIRFRIFPHPLPSLSLLLFSPYTCVCVCLRDILSGNLPILRMAWS